MGVALLLTAVIWAADMANGIDTADSSWFLWISDRAASGDVPYRDFFIGVLPLPLWISTGAVWVLGTEIAVLKLLIAAIYATTATLAAWLARRLGVGWLGTGLVGLACASFVFLPSGLPYSPLSYLLMLVALACVVGWRDRFEGRSEGGADLALAAGGVAAGLSCAGKQTVGAAAALALVACVVAWSPRGRTDVRGRARDLALALGAGAAALALTLVPVAITGGLPDMWEQAFNKSEYLKNSSVSYLDGLSTLWDSLGDPVDRWYELASHLVFLVPPLTAIVLIAVAARRSAPRALLPVVVFAFAAILPALPRAVYFKVSDAVPFCALAIAVALTAVAWPPGRQTLRRVLACATALVLAALLTANFARTPIENASDGLERSELAHFRQALVREGDLDAATAQARRLREADAGQDRTLVLSFSAGFLYLLSGLENRTPYDYPARNTVRDDGEEDIIARLEAGEIDRVCLGSYAASPTQRLERVESWVLSHMHPLDSQPALSSSLEPVECVIYASG